VAPTTVSAMSLAFCGEVEVTKTWMRGLVGCTSNEMLFVIAAGLSERLRRSLTLLATSPLLVRSA
jgi:hypothetical protein